MSVFLPFMKKKKNKIIYKKEQSRSSTNILNKLNGIRSSRIIILLILLNAIAVVAICFLLFVLARDSLVVLSFSKLRKDYPFVKKELLSFPLYSYAYAVYEKDSRVLVFSHNEDLRFAPASTTKIMTALVVLEHYDLNTILEVKKEYLAEGSKMGLFESERISVNNLLFGLLLPSGNDAAYVLANNYPGGLLAFVKRMNEKSSEFKLQNTYFVDPTGYSDENYTTAFDLARLSTKALENKKFSQIVKTKKSIVYNSTFTISHALENLNELLDRPYVIGVKTGFTQEAGGVLATALELGGKTYVVVVLKSQDRFFDTGQIIDKVIQKISLIKY